MHVHDAGFYRAPRGGGISQSTLFLLEAVAAGVAAVVLIVGWQVPLGRRADWIGAFIVAASAVGAVLLCRYVDVETIGPLPNMYEPTWEVPGKPLSASAEGGAALLSALGCTPSVGSASHRRARTDPRSRSGLLINCPAPSWHR